MINESNRKLNIVLVNDDGVHAPGLRILRETLQDIARVIIVAPLQERSTTGHTLTLDHTIRMEEISEDVYGCSGYPADCVLMAFGHLFRNKDAKYQGEKIDLVVSGINRGANLGQDVFYSGTVAAARQAAFHGVPSIAISSCMDFMTTDKSEMYYYTASNFIKTLVLLNITQSIAPMTILNINVPWCLEADVKGIKVTKVGLRNYSEEIDERLDFRGRKYYWIGGVYRGFELLEDSDCLAVEQKMISISPIKLLDYGMPKDALMDNLSAIVSNISMGNQGR